MQFFRRNYLILLTLIGLFLWFESDLLWRGSELLHLSRTGAAFYALSMLYRALFAFVALAFLHSMQHISKSASLFIAAALGMIYASISVGSFAFHHYFAAMPSHFAFRYIFEEPADAFLLLETGLTPTTLTAMVLLAAAIATMLFFSAKHFPKRLSHPGQLVTAIVLLVGLAPVFHNNVRFLPGASVSDVNMVFGLTQAATSPSELSEVRSLGEGMRTPLDRTQGRAPFNVLIIVNESIRAKSSSLFGAPNTTAAAVTEQLADSQDDLVLFPHAYSNSTSTLTSFPSILSGISPLQSPRLMHTSPLLFDIAKSFSDTKTFMVSSQSFKWGHFREFLQTSPIDTLWYMENSGIKARNAAALDDKAVADELIQALPGLAENGHFAGAIQFFGTHSPYHFDVDKASTLSSSAFDSEKYEAAMKRVDGQTARIFAALKAQGLWDNTLIISTSDHGEAFGEHGFYGHTRTFYDEEARVPLWMKLPHSKKKADIAMLRDNSRLPVSNIDILPTVFHLMTSGRATSPLNSHWLGQSLVHPLPNDRVIYLKSNRIDDDGEVFIGYAGISRNYKLMYRVDGAKRDWECFDLSKDSEEQHNDCSGVPQDLRKTLAQQIPHNDKMLHSSFFPDLTEVPAKP